MGRCCRDAVVLLQSEDLLAGLVTVTLWTDLRIGPRVVHLHQQVRSAVQDPGGSRTAVAPAASAIVNCAVAAASRVGKPTARTRWSVPVWITMAV